MVQTYLEIVNEFGELIDTLEYSNHINHKCINTFLYKSIDNRVSDTKNLTILKNLSKYKTTKKHYYIGYYNKLPYWSKTLRPILGTNENLSFEDDLKDAECDTASKACVDAVNKYSKDVCGSLPKGGLRSACHTTAKGMCTSCSAAVSVAGLCFNY